MKVIIFYLSSIYDWICDRYFNVKTVNSVKLKEHDNIINFMYEPLPYLEINNIFKKYPLEKEDHFIDFGCGKGRILVMAAKFGCKNIYGLDINQSLIEIAQHNLNSISERGQDLNTNLYCIDAKKYVFHPQINKIFYYNPFQLKVFIYTFKSLISSIKEYPRNVTVYFCGAQPSVLKQFEKYNCFQLIGIEDNLYVYEFVDRENRNERFSN